MTGSPASSAASSQAGLPSRGVEPVMAFRRGVHAAVMLVAAGLGAAAAAAVASAMGGDSRTVVLSAATVALASIASVLPALLSSPVGVSKFGFAVLGCSMARTLGVMAFGLMFVGMHALEKRPFWLGAVMGAAVVLIIEVVQAVRVLQKAPGVGR